MKKLLLLLVFPLITLGINAKQYKLVSPNGKLTVTVNNDKNLTYLLSLEGPVSYTHLTLPTICSV